ncbi:uncharacterized protein DEA37_0007041 [Paragonimus westermani]|uniref:Rap-GAP domain-containing protein n=1 Tax=Paragonimus westermani TaxID=34504 RepID=A0A5J4P0C8_9TREM|nr:uncharacterized protein DEA37_0007041 [Paragonimus westermani]
MWSNGSLERHMLQFWFLFEQLKRTYLPVIFPCLSPLYSIYELSQLKELKSPSEILSSLQDYPISPTLLPIYQETLVLWLTRFIDTNPKNYFPDLGSSIDERGTRQSTSTISHHFGLATGAGLVDVHSSEKDSTGANPPHSPIGDPLLINPEFFSSTHSSSVSSRREGDRGETRDPGRHKSSVASSSMNSVSSFDQPIIRRPSSPGRHPNLLENKTLSRVNESNMVCAVLYQCRQNINLLHDILHHAFLLPIQCYNALFAVINVYSSWLEEKRNRPIFLQDIDDSDTWTLRKSNSKLFGRFPFPEDEGHEGDDEAEDPKEFCSAGRSNSRNNLPFGGYTFAKVSSTAQSVAVNRSARSDSDSSSPIATTQDAHLTPRRQPHKTIASAKQEELRGCLQNIIQIMLDNMSKVFLLKCPPAVKTMQADSTGKHLNRTVDYVKHQVELCRRILHIVRLTADRNELSTETWTKLLFTLLDVMNATMISNSPSDRLDNSWLSNEKLIHTLFQTMNGALLRASLFAPISNEPWNRCLAVYSRLTHWAPLISEWKAIMNSLTGTMAKLVYGVDLSNLPKDSKHVRGKRSMANPTTGRIRPKSFTETVIGHTTSQLAGQSGFQLPSLSHAEISPNFIGHASVGDKSGVANGQLALRPHHAVSPDQPSLSAYPSGVSDWQHSSTKDASGSTVIDPSRDLSRTGGMEDEDSYLFGVNATLNDVQAPLDDVDTLLSIPHNMNRSLTRSSNRIPKSGTLVRNHQSEFLVLRRVASDLDEKFKQVSPHSIHDPTCGMVDCLEEPVLTSMSDCERVPTNGRFFTSSDNLSILSVGSVIDNRSRGHSMPRSSTLAMRTSESHRSLLLPMASFTSPPPPTLSGGLDDDSSSAFSRSGGFGTSGRESVDEDVKRKPGPVIPYRKRSDSTSGGFLRSPVDSCHRPPLHHTDTLTAPSNLDLDVGVLETPTKTNRNLSADSTVPRCLLAGGVARGWTQESIVICWRRFLGLLGNVTEIQVVSNLEKVYVYFSELVGVLLKIQQNQPLDPVSNECVRPIPDYNVPIEYILPSLFEILGHTDRVDLVKLSALRTLTEAIIRPPDRPINEEVIAQFYNVLHRYLAGSDQQFIHEVVRSCGMRFFSSELPASHILLLDFLKGISVVLGEDSFGKDLPHTEALMMLTSLLCYPRHFGTLECLDVDAVDSIQLIKCDELPSRLLNSLVQTTLGNPNAETRCLALAALAMHCVIELLHMEKSQDATNFPMEAILVLMGMMRFQDHSVALVAVEMVYMLAHFGNLFLDRMPKLPLLIIRLLVTFMLAITEWSLRLPLDLLLTPSQSPIEEPSITSDTVCKSVVFSVLSALYTVLCGTSFPTTVPPTTVADGSSICENRTTDHRVTDPLASFSFECNIPLNFEAFSAPKGRLDTSSLTIRSFIMSSYGHPWSGYQQLGEPGAQPVQSIRLAARVALCHLLNHLNHYPLDNHGAQLNTLIQEHHDQAGDQGDLNSTEVAELSLSTLKNGNCQLFALNGSVLLTCLTLPAHVGTSPFLSNPNGLPPLQRSFATDLFNFNPFSCAQGSTTESAALQQAVSDSQYTRIIVRDFSGKYIWDMPFLHGLWDGSVLPCSRGVSPSNETSASQTDACSNLRNMPPCPPPRMNPHPPPLKYGEHAGLIRADANSPIETQPVSSADATSLSPESPPSSRLDDTQHQRISCPADALSLLLQELSISSPECVTVQSNDSGKTCSSQPDNACANMETLTLGQITAQCQLDEETLRLHENVKRAATSSSVDPEAAAISRQDRYSPRTPPTSPTLVSSNLPQPSLEQFASCRHLLNQLGFLSFERRCTIDLVQKSAGLVRDLKHLDKFGVRETHKIAVFYVGSGQEDKQSILANQTASLEFENFVAGLGWEVDLLTHRGFRGGLEQSGRAGSSTPYYATATLEVIFHVSTRMPSSTQEDLKYKHLGNDEVMIIWTENVRTFTRSVLRTQFGDVLIVISPLPNGLFRVEVRRESVVGFFGPIVHVAVLDSISLPSLVRATAINASRAIRAMKPGYRAQYPFHFSVLYWWISDAPC